MKTTTALFADRTEAEAAMNELVSDHYEPRRFRLQRAGQPHNAPSPRPSEPFEVRPRSSVLAGWGALTGTAVVSLGALTISALGGGDTIAAVTLQAALGATFIGAGLGAIIGAYAGLANWTVAATLDAPSDGPVFLTYRGPDERAEKLADKLQDAGALDVLAA